MTKLTIPQKFCLEVKKLAEKYKVPFFVVTEGASATVNYNSPAVKNARQAHIKWEQQNGINSQHDWEK